MLPDEDDRGQLIVIIALVLGMTFVILALVLNAAIFTENLATRETVNSEGATEYASSIEPAVESDYERTNENATRKAVHAATTFNDSLDVWADEQADRAAREGAIFTANWTTHVGWRLDQSTDDSFAPADNRTATNWTLASGARNVSTFEMNVMRADLFNGTTGLTDFEDEAFRLNVSDGTTTWELYVFRNSNNSTIVVYDGDPTGLDLGGLIDSTDSCVRATDRAVIDVRNGTFNGTDCSALEAPSSMDGRLDVRYENVRNSSDGEQVNGTYTVVVNGSNAVPKTGGEPTKFNRSGEAPPTATAVVYAVEYETYYEQEGVIHDPEGRYAPREEVR
jgi:hypothetical protein